MSAVMKVETWGLMVDAFLCTTRPLFRLTPCLEEHLFPSSGFILTRNLFSHQNTICLVTQSRH